MGASTRDLWLRRPVQTLAGVNWRQSFGRVSGVLRQLTLTGVNGRRYNDAGSPDFRATLLASPKSEPHLMR